MKSKGKLRGRNNAPITMSRLKGRSCLADSLPWFWNGSHPFVTKAFGLWPHTSSKSKFQKNNPISASLFTCTSIQFNSIILLCNLSSYKINILEKGKITWETVNNLNYYDKKKKKKTKTKITTVKHSNHNILSIVSSRNQVINGGFVFFNPWKLPWPCCVHHILFTLYHRHHFIQFCIPIFK